jgi:deoxyhypusine synthase
MKVKRSFAPVAMLVALLLAPPPALGQAVAEATPPPSGAATAAGAQPPVPGDPTAAPPAPLGATAADDSAPASKAEVKSLAEEVRRLKLEIGLPEPEYRSYQGLGPAASKVYFTPKGLSIGGYGEILYTNYLGNSSTPSFTDLLRLVLYTGYRFSEKIVFNAEIEFEHGNTEKGEVAVEFAYVDFLLAEPLSIRLGNVLIPNGSYGAIIEKKMQTLLQKLWREGVREISSSQFCREIGKRICNETSILYWAARNGVPVFIPGITDGAVGYQAWLFSQDHDFRLNLLKDSGMLNDIVFDAKKSGALLIGGGISKHHTLWWNQFKEGLDYAVYISTAEEWDGSLSGARPQEAVSWGKINEKADKEMIEGDASLILPIMVNSLLDRLNKA